MNLEIVLHRYVLCYNDFPNLVRELVSKEMGSTEGRFLKLGRTY